MGARLWGDAVTEDGSFRYELGSDKPSWMSRLLWLTVALAVLQVLRVIVTHGPGRALILPVIWVLLAGLAFWQRRHRYAVIVDADGIRMPLKRRPLPWQAVRAIERPGPYSDVVVLHLRDGSDKRVPIPSRFAERMALIGGVPLERSKGIEPSPRHPTDSLGAGDREMAG